MATDFVITAENNPQLFRDVAFKSGATTYSFDLSPWAEDNNTVSTATWTVKAGQATISGQALTSNVASALITFSESGGSLIKIVCASSSEIYVIYLDILAKDPSVISTNDYGLCL